MTKKIKLTKGQVALVSDHRYEELNQYKWQARLDENTQKYYAERHDKGRTIGMHRVVANTPDHLVCDHINHDTLDNRDDNLRNVTYSQNRMNARVRRDNKLGHKNIIIHKGKYRIKIEANGYVFYARVPTLDQAIIVRDQKLREIHGEYACGTGCAE